MRKRMTELNRALFDTKAILQHYSDEEGAAPIQLRALREAYKAMEFKKELLDSVKGFEVTRNRAQCRIDFVPLALKSENTFATETVDFAMHVLQKVVTEYFDSKTY